MSEADKSHPHNIHIRSDYDSLKEDIGRAETDHDKDMASANGRMDRQDERMGKMEDRLLSMEKWQMLCYGIAIGVGALAVYALKGLGLSP